MLESMALTLGLKHSLVREPDMDNEVTAIALEPGPMADGCVPSSLVRERSWP